MKLLKIAWRNLWRSKTRTLLTAFVVFFVVILSILMSSQQYGMYDNMIDNVTEFTGHIQVHDSDYVDSRSMNDAFELSQSQLDEIEQIEHILKVAPRIESFSLASYGDKTKGVAVLGVNPSSEKEISKLDLKLARYKLTVDSTWFEKEDYEKLKPIVGDSYTKEAIMKNRISKLIGKEETNKHWDKITSSSFINSQYLNPGDKGVLIGEALGEYLNINLGDTLVMISQGYHGASAANLFVVKGFLKLPLVELERGMVIMELSTCQEFYSAPQMATTVMVKIDKNNNMEKVSASLNELLPKEQVAKTWSELQPETVQMIESDKAGGVFMKGIFYMIIGFIIFGTIMMMLSERKREFGILIAVGLQRGKLALILLYETLMISFLGTLIGFGLSFPIITALHNNPIPLQGDMAEMMEEYGFEAIIFFSNSGYIFYTQALIIFIVSIVIFLFPLMGLGKLNVIKAIRG
ncbi:MAG: FtsX-like permease family protein [Bacteroidales bacterium]|nr:FtsX-like permease family protein [Bacteroidales bacterium]